MGMRNISKFIANGTKMIVRQMYTNIIEAEIINGPGKGKIIAIPRITLIEELHKEGTTLRRPQFPVKVAYAMTIDKSQGQSLERVGLYLITEYFAHGQLYTGCSRAKCPTAISFYIPLINGEEKTKNIVWKEVLLET